jgi:hypothetical protein
VTSTERGMRSAEHCQQLKLTLNSRYSKPEHYGIITVPLPKLREVNHIRTNSFVLPINASSAAMALSFHSSLFPLNDNETMSTNSSNYCRMMFLLKSKLVEFAELIYTYSKSFLSSFCLRRV